ncbi:MAG: sel1 repeat family protein [Magnetococcales bacterium]|nr:sel1 repeat family protein [Magnetococcales bacterium]
MNTEEFVTLFPRWGTLFSADLHAHFWPMPEEISRFLASEAVVENAQGPVPAVSAPAETSETVSAEEAAADELSRLKAAAAAGQPKAQHYLAALYSTGTGGVEQNWPEAIALYHKAATQGLAIAQNNLGFLYATGQGVAVDPMQSFMWFQLAYQGGYQEAGPNLELLAKHLTDEQRQQAETMAMQQLARQQAAIK